MIFLFQQHQWAKTPPIYFSLLIRMYEIELITILAFMRTSSHVKNRDMSVCNAYRIPAIKNKKQI